MDLLRRFLFISLALGLCTVTARAQGPDVDKVSDTPPDQKDSSNTIPNDEANQSVDSTQTSGNNVTVEEPASTTVEPTVSVVPTDPETTEEAVTQPDTTTEKEVVKTTNVKTTHAPIVTIPKPPHVPPETTYIERLVLVGWVGTRTRSYTLMSRYTPQFKSSKGRY